MKGLLRYWWIAALALLILAVVSAWRSHANANQWKAERDKARAAIAATLAENTRLLDSASHWKATADSFAKAQATTTTHTHEQVHHLPPPVTPSDTSRDHIIADLEHQVGDYQQQLADEIRHSAQLASQLGKTDTVLVKADSVLKTAPVGTPWWKYLVPEIRVGVGPAFTPEAGDHWHPVAVTAGLSWKLPL